MNTDQLILKLKSWHWRNWFFTVFALSLFIYVLADTKVKNTHNRSPSLDTSVDTFIPKGFVLIPIQIQNFESLDSVLGQFGVVDLYRYQEKAERKTKLIAKSIRLLRSPLNPNHFGVLAPENQASFVLSSGPIYWVALKNPTQSGTVFENIPQKKPKRRVIYE